MFVALLVVGWVAGAVLLAPSDPGDGPGVERPRAVPAPPVPGTVVAPRAQEGFDDLLQPRAAGLVGRGTPDERFDWLPDRIDEETLLVVNRMSDESRERIRARPGEVASLVLEAHLAERMGDGASAIRRCDLAIERDARYGAAWTVRGWALLRVHSYSVAVLDLRRGAQLSHDPTWAWIGLGRWAEHEGDPAAALRAYREALRLGGAGSSPVDHEADLRARIERLSAGAPR